MLHVKETAKRSALEVEEVVSLSADPISVAESRAWIRNILSDWESPDRCEAVVLVATELVTNVLLHTDSSPTLRLVRRPDCMRLEIADTSRFGPRKRNYAAESTTGRGMVLVDSLTTRWGCDPTPDGKVVWCEFAAEATL